MGERSHRCHRGDGIGVSATAEQYVHGAGMATPGSKVQRRDAANGGSVDEPEAGP